MWREVVHFVPEKLSLTSPSSLRGAEVTSQSEMASAHLGITEMHSCTLPRIKVLQDRWFNTTHQHSNFTDDEINLAVADYEKLRELIKIFLNTDLNRDINSNPTLFGQNVDKINLSQGQTVLLQLCVAIHSQKAKLNESIVFMDEPENHLHPEALIEVIQRVRDILSDGQLWIATYSVHLLTHFPPSCIWYMENGTVSYAGSVPERVLKSLMGGEDEIVKLANFLTLPAQMAAVQFAFECLIPPKAVTTAPDDPQTRQIHEGIKSLVDSSKKLKVLDFGAGQGRLLSAIRETDAQINVEAADWLDYIAFDLPSPVDQALCESVLTDAYGNADKRYFHSADKLLSDHMPGSFDAVILCNVFHELDPFLWLEIFGEHGVIRKCLRPDGNLIIVADQLIPVGEKAYKNGFLVFDVVQFKLLFELDSYRIDTRNNDRLKAHFIPASAIGNITSKSRKESIENFNVTALQKVRTLRDAEPNHKNGRLNALWSQQAVNSQLVLSQL